MDIQNEIQVVEHLIDTFKREIYWVENNFLPGPNGELYIQKRNDAIELLEEYLEETLL